MVKNRPGETENSPCSLPERSSVSHPRNEQTTNTVEAIRLRQIRLRLGEKYYDVSPASDRIAACVLADLRDSEERPSIFS